LTHGIGNNENQNKPSNLYDSMPHFLFPSQKNDELKKLAKAAGSKKRPNRYYSNITKKNSRLFLADSIWMVSAKGK
jgi:hypothetical protein